MFLALGQVLTISVEAGMKDNFKKSIISFGYKEIHFTFIRATLSFFKKFGGGMTAQSVESATPSQKIVGSNNPRTLLLSLSV